MNTATLTEEVILARFYRLKFTIGLSATKFGYLSVGQPSLIKRLEEGKSLRAKSKRRIALCLDTIEREHSMPLPVHKAGTKLDAEQENIPNSEEVIRSSMEE